MQEDRSVRFEWGMAGSKRLAAECACLVVVDVLSFSTSVSVAVERGTEVFPYPWPAENLTDFAAEISAPIAGGRKRVTDDAPWSISPAALRAAPFAKRLLMPSPNGSAIAASAGGTCVIAACLRNAAAVGQWLGEQGLGRPDRPVAVIAAGERWPDGSLRPAVEDYLGAGAVIAALTGPGISRSAEAECARACYAGIENPAEIVRDCASGRELRDAGYEADLAVAVEIDRSAVVPLLADGAFRDAALIPGNVIAESRGPRSGQRTGR